MAFEDHRLELKKNDIQTATPSEHSSRYKDTKETRIREQYELFYRQIFPILEKNTMNFKNIAEQTKLKERRIRETLLYRLIPDNSIQLIGYTAGYCYVCSNSMQSSTAQEPLCLSCLESIHGAIQNLYPSKSDISGGADNPISGTGITSALDSDRIAKTLDSILEATSDGLETSNYPPNTEKRTDTYESLLNEVKIYREKYGPLDAETLAEGQTSQPLKLHLVTDDENTSEARDTVQPLPVIEGYPHEDSVEAEVALMAANGTLRHYGFQRIKPRV